MSDLRSKLIRIAHENPEVREHVLPLLTSKQAAREVVSVADGIEQGCAALVLAFRDSLVREMPDIFKKENGDASLDINSYGAGVRLTILNQLVPDKEGSALVGVLWDRNSGRLELQIALTFPHTQPVMKVFNIDVDVTKDQVEGKYGTGIRKWVMGFLLEVHTAWEKAGLLPS